ncbi:MAG TPA: acetyl-CoA carboxylase biotin carboxyl carrier protein [Planctomycetota bacterium]|nr:acetyl-CoA carboxylase biotin carboxyl carrier protein [Planctomycetota bacterium]
MDLNEIRKILDLMDANGLVEFEYEEQGRKIRLRRPDSGNSAGSHAAPAPAAQAVPMALPVHSAPPPPAEKPANLVDYKSPLVGTFYRSAKPDSDPFVNIGDEVTPDRVLCIIEAMKVMNEIKAEMTGVVREILVKNGQAVEFGEVLFQIEKR